MQALKHFYYTRGGRIWTAYGFADAFNDAEEWVSDGHLAIDQGPITIGMIKNSTGLLWRLFMNCPEVQRGLRRLDFRSPWLDGHPGQEEGSTRGLKRLITALCLLATTVVGAHAAPWIRVNQLGYLPGAIKVAVLVDTAAGLPCRGSRSVTSSPGGWCWLRRRRRRAESTGRSEFVAAHLLRLEAPGRAISAVQAPALPCSASPPMCTMDRQTPAAVYASAAVRRQSLPQRFLPHAGWLRHLWPAGRLCIRGCGRRLA